MVPEPTAAATSTPSEQNKDSVEEVNSSAAINHSEDDSGNENSQNGASRTKLNGSENGNSRPNSNGRENGNGRNGEVGCSSVSSVADSGHVEAVGLFEVLSMGKRAMEDVLDDWIDAYLKDRDPSLLDMISFFIQCCGCKGVVAAEMCRSRGNSKVMSKLVEELDENSGLQYKKFMAFPWILTVTWPVDADCVEYPLIQPPPYGRWFHNELCDFVSVLVSQCQYSVIFDCYLMSTLISLLTELSNSQVRAFRHTCTLAAVKMLSSLVTVAQSLTGSIKNNEKLYEEQKAGKQKSALQMEKMKKKITQLHDKRVEIENMMDVIFKGVFLKRYRDTVPEIRSICMEELGMWMKNYSCAFLNDSYLKYIGWMLYDKMPDVRLKCVVGLQTLYGDTQLYSKLDLFTVRFKERLISMTLDKDNEVAVHAMKVLVLISKQAADVFTPEEYKLLLLFVYATHRPLAASAGELLFFRLIDVPAPARDTQDEVSWEEARKRQTVAKLKAMLQFYRDSKLHNHVVYLVDSLWDCGAALLRDWPMLTSVLLAEPSSQPTGLTEEDQNVIVEVLVASVRQASEGPGLPGRSGAKKPTTTREKKIQMDDCTKLTQHLLEVLPQLLSKFSRNADLVASLMKIPQYFLPESPEAENTQALPGLMAEMEAALEQHSSAGVVEAAARTYLSLCEEETPRGPVARAARDTLVQRWMDKLTTLLRETLMGDSFSADEKKTKEIVNTLKKLRIFHNCHDLSRWNVFELLYPLLSVENGQGGAPPQVLLEVLQCMCYSILWSLNASSETSISKEQSAVQRHQLCLFCEQSHHCFSLPDPDVRQQAFLGICDVLVAHSHQRHTSFGSPVYTPSPKLQSALLNFLSANIFVGSDSESAVSVSENSERLEDVHLRRNLLAAYCKLVIHGVLEMSMAAEVLMYYTKYYNDFGDIIKVTLFRTRQMDKIESARLLVHCVQELFVRLKRKQENDTWVHSGVQTYTCIKELARRFSLTFRDLVKFRESVVLIHRSGIEFVFKDFVQTPDMPAPPYLSYLTILSEFSSKLLRPDKKALLAFVHRHTTQHIIDLRDECWQPLIYYRASLLAVAEGEDALSYVSSDRRMQGPLRSTLQKQRLEGSKSPCPSSIADSRASTVPRPSPCPSPRSRPSPCPSPRSRPSPCPSPRSRPSPSPSHQEKTASSAPATPTPSLPPPPSPLPPPPATPSLLPPPSPLPPPPPSLLPPPSPLPPPPATPSLLPPPPAPAPEEPPAKRLKMELTVLSTVDEAEDDDDPVDVEL